MNPDGDSRPSQLTVVGGTRLFFVADDGVHGRELWETDGTATGTILREVNPGPDGSNPIGLTAVGNALYFGAFDEINGYELWRSMSPAERVANFNTGSSSLPQIIGETNGKVLFSAENNDGDRNLYTSSGPGFVNALQEAGVIFTPTRSMTLSEGGTSISYSVKLATKPSNVVTLTLGGYPNQILLSTNTLTFTSANWNQEQLVTITAINDLIEESALTIDISHTLTSTDAIYGAIGRRDLAVQLTDNDVAGIVFAPPTTLVTNEFGTKTSFGVSLNSQPIADVSFLILSTDTTEGIVSTYQVTFTASNWNVPQVVTVTGVGDSISDGEQVYQIITSATASYDGFYNGLSVADLTLTNTEIDTNRVPTDISLSSSTIPENAGTNAAVGTLSTTDPDLGNAFTYRLVSGAGDTDNAAFNITSALLRATSSFNFEAKSSYSIRIRSTDQGGLFTEKAFIITVTDVTEVSFQNPINPFDVDSDRFVGPLDVLTIINLLNSVAPSIPLSQLPKSTPFVNVNGDNQINPLDVLSLISFINSRNTGGEGEGFTHFVGLLLPDNATRSSVSSQSSLSVERRPDRFHPDIAPRIVAASPLWSCDVTEAVFESITDVEFEELIQPSADEIGLQLINRDDFFTNFGRD